MYSLPENSKKIIEGYLHIKFGPYVLPCPYFMNKRGRRNLSVVDAGKGTPEEIETELEVWYEKYKSVIRDEIDAKNVLELLQIGVDCSGFVVNVLGLGRGIKYPNIISWVRALVRPRTNISADLLTGPLNSSEVELSEVRPGDLIRRGRTHVMLVEWVDEKKIGYIGSSTRPTWGVQRGEIEITNASKSLEFQRWSVKDDLEIYKAAEGGRGLRRLKVLVQ